MNTLASAISGALIDFVWQGSIVGFSLWFVLYALRKRSANLRYWVSSAALALMALMPVVTTLALYRGSGHPGPAVAAVVGQIPAAVRASVVDRWVSVSRLQSLKLWALPLWSLGVLAFSVRLLVGYRHAFQLGRSGKPATGDILMVVERLQRVMSVRRRVRVLISALSDSPSVVGWLRPVILLPAATLMGLTAFQLEAVLAHEIGHIKRYDYLLNMLQMVVETLLFYHPAVWWTSRRIRVERELCCDDLAVHFSGNALGYARALTRLEKLRLGAPRVAMASTGGPLLYRIQRLVGVTTKEYGPSRLPALLAIGLGVLIFALNVSWIHGQDAPGVSVDLGSSSIIHRTPVRYPEAAKKQGISGTVQLEVTLDATGNVSDARVLSGPEEFRKPALESVLNWHFTSEAAGATRLITISFSEKGAQVLVREPREADRSSAPNPGVGGGIGTGLGRGVGEGKGLGVGAGEGGGTGGELELLKAELERQRQKEFVAYAKLADDRKKAIAAESDNNRTQQEVVLVRRRALESDLRSAETALQLRVKEAGNAAALTEAQKLEVDAMKAKLAAIRSELEGGPSLGFARENPVIGRTLKSIGAPNLTASVLNDLVLRLPVRQGDILSAKLIEQTMAAVRNYDEHLGVQFSPTDDGMAELRINAPGERR